MLVIGDSEEAKTLNGVAYSFGSKNDIPYTNTAAVDINIVLDSTDPAPSCSYGQRHIR